MTGTYDAQLDLLYWTTGNPCPDYNGDDRKGDNLYSDSVLALLGTLCAGTGGTPPRRILVVGCEPASVEEGIGLSAPVEAAVPEAVRLVLSLLDDNGNGNGPGNGAGPRSASRPDTAAVSTVEAVPAVGPAAVAAGPYDQQHDRGAIQERNTSPC